MPLRATLNIRTVLENLLDIVGAQASALMDGKIEISASGNSTVYNGQHIPYFEEVLNNLTITARVPIMTILSDTLSGLRNSSVLDSLNGTLDSAGDLLGNIAKLSDILGD